MAQAAMLAGLGAAAQPDLAWAAASPAWAMPDEAMPHRRTWMSFGASQAIWGDRLLRTVRKDLGTIARAIVEFEPVSVLVRPAEMAAARAACGPKVELLACPVDDLWVRDTGCVFVRAADDQRAAVDFNFNGWGNKQAHAADRAVAAFMSSAAKVQRLRTPLTLEGGAIEVDGEGTALITESCVLNDNRNPGRSKAEVEKALGALLGVHRIIWLPGLRGHEITDGHTDFYARFAGPAVVCAHLDNDPASRWIVRRRATARSRWCRPLRRCRH